MSVYLIFNPVAGQSNPEQDLAQIRARLEPQFELEVLFTTPEIEARELAQQAIAQGAEMVIASGGDGTLSDVADALIETQIPLGVISRGTANAFANALGLPDTIDSACDNILAGQTRDVDVAYCNGRPMVLLAGIGFEAETVAKASRERKNRLGILAYILAGIEQLRELNPFTAILETDDRTITVTASAITVANAAPATSILAQGPSDLIVDDGLLDVTIVAPANITSAIAASYHLLQTALSGNPVQRDDIGYFRTKSVKITTNPPQKVVVDGELMESQALDIQCLPQALRLIVPRLEESPPVEKLENLPDLIVEEKYSFTAVHESSLPTE